MSPSRLSLPWNAVAFVCFFLFCFFSEPDQDLLRSAEGAGHPAVGGRGGGGRRRRRRRREAEKEEAQEGPPAQQEGQERPQRPAHQPPPLARPVSFAWIHFIHFTR